jgi:hypothetical protein
VGVDLMLVKVVELVLVVLENHPVQQQVVILHHL